MEKFILWTLAIFSMMDWIAVAKHNKKLEYVFKPGVMLVLLLYLFITTHLIDGTIWFAFGICFSLVGDVFLMLPRKSFMYGLVFFLFAHMAYIAGFISFDPEFNLVSIILLTVISTVSFRVYCLLTSRKVYFVKRSLKFAILMYTIVISTMLFCATLSLSSETWLFAPAFMVSLGALFFYTSDSIIALNRYVPGIQLGRLLSMITYHCGQGLIIIGIVNQSQSLIS